MAIFYIALLAIIIGLILLVLWWMLALEYSIKEKKKRNIFLFIVLNLLGLTPLYSDLDKPLNKQYGRRLKILHHLGWLSLIIGLLLMLLN